MNKITSTEFKNYSQQFRQLFLRALALPDFEQLSKEEQEKHISALSLCLQHVELENVLAVWNSCLFSEEILKEDLSAIKNRVKEHIIARGNYNPASPLSLSEYRERKNKAVGKDWEKLRNQEHFYQSGAEMSEEDFQFIRLFKEYSDKIEEFISEEENKLDQEGWEMKGFILEDILKTIEKAQANLEAKKKKKTILLPNLRLPLTLINQP